MAYKAIVTRLQNVRAHSNADRVKLATCHGNQVVVGLNSNEGDLGVYFPSDGQLSHEFCKYNNLYRDGSMNREKDKTGMFDANRRVRAQRFRGEISDGFWVPLSNFLFVTDVNPAASFDSLGIEGFEFDEYEGVPICSKYVNAATLKAASQNQGKSTRAARTSVMFKEHFDTAHFGKNIHEFTEGQHIIVTEKLHGTSHRIGYVQTQRNLTWLEKLAKRFGVQVQETEWKYLNGTRRVVLGENTGKNQFHDVTIRDKAAKLFEGILRKGETVFLEIVGYESNGKPIMPTVGTKGLADKNFTKTYGEQMTYSYGCESGQCEIYVYRMTFTNEDGQSVDYSWNDVVNRCNEMGVKHVPHIATFTLGELKYQNHLEDDRDVQEFFEKEITRMGSGPSVLDSSHIKEGVCVRIEGGLNNKTFKFKSFEFKVLEGIVKDSGVVDAEEAQG